MAGKRFAHFCISYHDGSATVDNLQQGGKRIGRAEKRADIPIGGLKKGGEHDSLEEAMYQQVKKMEGM
jgi:hypothetical protein